MADHGEAVLMYTCRESSMDKSKLHWAANADRAPEPAQRSAPEQPHPRRYVDSRSAGWRDDR